MKAVCTAFLCLLLGGYNMAYAARVAGECKKLAGKTIVIGTKLDPIVEQFVSLDTTLVDAEGKFAFEFSLSQTMVCRIPIGNIEAMLVVVPDADYDIRLPGFEVLSLAKKLNPFYQREEIPALVVKGDAIELNAHWWFYEAVFFARLPRGHFGYFTRWNWRRSMENAGGYLVP